MVVRRSGLLAVLAVALAARAHAAELAVSGADGCFDVETIADQVADLLGHPLGSVTGVDFEVTLARAQQAKWTLRLDVLEGTRADHERRSRELTADSCAELADAVAVAIAMTVSSRGAAAPPSLVAPPSPQAKPATVVTRPPAATAATAATPATVAGGVMVVGDSGVLPRPGAGIELSASLRYRWLRLTLAGTAFASQVTRATTDAGGEFRLLFGSAQVCLARAVGRTVLLGCAGFELGRLSAEGIGVLNPQLGSAPWRAARAELGLSIPVAARVALLVRGGVSLPLSRPQFVIDGTIPVHRPGSVAIRLALGAEVEF